FLLMIEIINSSSLHKLQASISLRCRTSSVRHHILVFRFVTVYRNNRIVRRIAIGAPDIAHQSGTTLAAQQHHTKQFNSVFRFDFIIDYLHHYFRDAPICKKHSVLSKNKSQRLAALARTAYCKCTVV
ncbi:MAG: hypothetical protein KAJ73_01640, partial [Zetaproteobacteria bacterium]|nr:hypothetical protein [Zetaproteobacteria bacterium]